MKRYFLLIFTFFLISSSLIAQNELNTFPMQWNEEEVQVTQDVPSHFLGLYQLQSDEGNTMIQIDWEKESYSWNQTLLDPFTKDYEWLDNEKKSINWGFLTKDGKLASTEIHKYENGVVKKKKGYIFIYKDIQTKEYHFMNVVEEGNSITLGKASKHSELATK